MAALAVDVGRLYAEREELQSGADAAALAVAKQCAKTPVDCAVSVLDGTAGKYADDNAKDGASTVAVLCGRIEGSDLPGCPDQPDNLTACINDPPDGDYVEVRTSTEMADGSTLLPPVFAQALLGNEGYDGTTVAACARATYGAPSRARSLALTVSYCEWEQYTSDGTAFAPPPPADPTPYEKTIKLHTTTGLASCPAGPSGWDRPGGFGWINPKDENCEVVLDGNGTYTGDTGANAPKDGCLLALQDAVLSGAPLFLPVYEAVCCSGTNATYRLKGFAAFVVTGYYWPSTKDVSKVLNPTVNQCKGTDRCIFGYFTQALVPATGSIGGPDLGARIVTLIG
jgi:hypothetical protein